LRELLIQPRTWRRRVLHPRLRSLANPDKARRGMQYAAIGMLLAIIGTLAQFGYRHLRMDHVGLVVGTGSASRWAPRCR